MLGKHFVYVLMRKDGACFKIGHSTDLPRRLRHLNRHYGPFSSEHSYALRAASKYKARKLEEAVRTLLEAYRIRLPIGQKPDGQTEWFTGPSFAVLAKNRDAILSFHLGEGGAPEPIDVEAIAPLSSLHRARLKKVGRVIDGIAGQLRSRWDNAEAMRAFRKCIIAHRADFLGAAKVPGEDGRVRFELFLNPGACSKDELNEVRGYARLTSTNETACAVTNFGASLMSVDEYQKIMVEFGAHPDRQIHEESWDSSGLLEEIESICADMADAYPLPQAYRQYVGESILDRMTEAQRAELSRALWAGLFGYVGLSPRSASNSPSP